MQEWKDKILCGDCVQILGQLKKPIADLVFADPPFNIGYNYDKHNDRLKKEKYLHWSKQWISAAINALKPRGSFYIAIGDEYAAEIKTIAQQQGLYLRNWIIWHYTFGQQTKAKFARSHTHILYFVRDKDNFTFNDYAVRVPSDRQLIYNDKRANPAGKMPNDVWTEYSRVCGTFKERCGWHPCQMPVRLLERIIALSSNIGDTVLDPFIGSGTTAVAAKNLKRHYIGIDISENYVEKVRARLKQNSDRSPVPAGVSLSEFEYNELVRLCIESDLAPTEIVQNPKLLDIIVSLFEIRLGNVKKFAKEQIRTALNEIEWTRPKKQERLLKQ